jgi:phosphatidylserine decarboxylase
VSFINQQALPANGNLLNLFSLFLHVVPKNLISFITGTVVRLPLGNGTVRKFASTFNIDMSEAEHPIAHYATIEDLFTRALKPGARTPVGPVCSPADGMLARSAGCENGTALQCKGFEYSLKELVFGPTEDPERERVRLAWQQTVYLAPHNYHRVHAPFTGRVTALRYLPGELWPVNVPFVLRIPRLFARNERLVFDFELETGGKAYVVMVGALNVGRMVTPLKPGFVTNAVARQTGGARPVVERFSPAKELKIGDELGTFMLGSTVVIAYDETALERIKLVPNEENRPILMGQPLTVQENQ